MKSDSSAAQRSNCEYLFISQSHVDTKTCAPFWMLWKYFVLATVFNTLGQ